MNTNSQIVKGYHLDKLIGEGGFGKVYIAVQQSIGREVAMKIIKASYANQPEFIRRFDSEAQLIARLEHPHIVPLIDYWRDTTGAYLVMRYVRGGSLRDLLRKDGALELYNISTILDQLAFALDFAHRQQVIHRDIKPDNILLDEEGNIYLADFGIAKDLKLNNSNTDPDAVVGSLHYISPEQARSEPVTGRTDVYSLGVVLYELLTGKHPFADETMMSILYKHINDPLPDIATLDNISDMVRDNINTIIQRATQKDPANRYPDVLTIALAFREAIGRGDTEEAFNVEESLTMREHEVLTLLATGMSNREIAEALFVSKGTVKFHLQNLYRKLGVSTRVQASIRAKKLNLITTELVADILPADVGTVIGKSISLPDLENPYKGLLAFQAGDARDFFGRAELSDKLVNLLAEDDPYQRFLAIVGPSGSGKSSLTRAGIIPRIGQGNLLPSKDWFVADLLPGSRPLDSLEIALEHIAANHISNIHDHLERDEFGLVRVANLILPKDDSQLVLVIDQFEEIFTQVEDEAKRQHLLDLIYTAVTAKRSRVYVIITLRADYYDRPLHYPKFGAMLRARMETILPLTAKGLERAISGPAERVAVTFEAGLVAQIVSEMNYQAGALPLLQYALTGLFEKHEDRVLTHEAYQEIGGAVGALAKRADEIFTQHTDLERELIRQLFLRLVTLGEGAEDTRRRATLRELLSITEHSDLLEEIIDQFADHRLLSLDHDEETRQPTVEVAHEAILREWDQLRQWLNDSREDIRQQRIVARAANDWEANERTQGYLWREERLTSAENWVETTQLSLTPLEQQFLKESIKQREHEAQEETQRKQREQAQENRSRNLLRSLVAIFALATILSGGLGAFAFQQRNEALDAQDDTLDALDIAQRSALAFAANNAFDRDEADLAIVLAVESAQGTEQLLPETLRVLERIANNPGPSTWIDLEDFFCRYIQSRDGRYMAITDCKETIEIWDMTTGELIQTLSAPDVTFYEGGEFSPSGQRIVTINNNLEELQLFTIWDIATGEIINQINIPDAYSYWYGWNENLIEIWTETVFEAPFDKAIRLYDVTTGELVTEYVFPDTYWSWASFSTDGTLGILGGWADYETKEQYQVSVFDTTTGEIIDQYIRDREGEIDAPFAGAYPAGFSPDNSIIWFAGYPNYFIDRETGETLFTVEGNRIFWISDDFESVIVSTDEEGGDIDSFSIISLEDGSLISELPTLFDPYTVSDMNALVTGKHGTPRYWALWDLNTREATRTQLIDSDWWFNVDFDQTTGNFALINRPSLLQVWNADGTEIIFEELRDDYSGFSVAWSPDGQYLAAGTLEDGLYIYNTTTWEIHSHLTDIEQPWLGSVKFTNDSRYVMAGNFSWQVQTFYQEAPFILIWDIETGEVAQRIEFPDEEENYGIEDIELHPTENIAYVSIWDTYTTTRGFLVDLTDGSIIQEVILDQLPTNGVFSHDGQYLIIAGLEGAVYVLSTENYQVEWQWQTLDFDIGGIDISPDGQFLSTGSGGSSFEAAVSLWNFETGQLYRRYFGHQHQGFLNDIDFNLDGTQIVSSGTGNVFMWEVDTQTDLEWILENRVVRDLTCAERRIYRVEPLCDE